MGNYAPPTLVFCKAMPVCPSPLSHSRHSYASLTHKFSCTLKETQRCCSILISLVISLQCIISLHVAVAQYNIALRVCVCVSERATQFAWGGCLCARWIIVQGYSTWQLVVGCVAMRATDVFYVDKVSLCPYNVHKEKQQISECIKNNICKATLENHWILMAWNYNNCTFLLVYHCFVARAPKRPTSAALLLVFFVFFFK